MDVYGAWIIGIELLNAQNNVVIQYAQEDLILLDKENISNYYVTKVKQGKHSLVVPLGAKAKLNLFNPQFSDLPDGVYTIKIIDISGAFWVHQVIK